MIIKCIKHAGSKYANTELLTCGPAKNAFLGQEIRIAPQCLCINFTAFRKHDDVEQ